MEGGHPTKVEAKNRELVNAMIALQSARPGLLLGSKRTDIAIVEDNVIPLILLEIKIGVKKLRAIKVDLDKIPTTIGLMKARFAANVIGASVFQLHISGTQGRIHAPDFLAAAVKTESALNAELETYAGSRPGFGFQMHPLQPPDGGIVERDIDFDGQEMSWGEHGHAARYHAVIIRSTRPVPPETGTFEDLIRDRDE